MSAVAKLKNEPSLVESSFRAIVRIAFYLSSITTIRVAIKFAAQPVL